MNPRRAPNVQALTTLGHHTQRHSAIGRAYGSRANDERRTLGRVAVRRTRIVDGTNHRIRTIASPTSFIWDNSDAWLASIREFIGVQKPPAEIDRVLATVLFTDIVGSTEKVAQSGDSRWKKVLAAHDERARREIERHRGRYIESTGDGLLATFDGPARAVRRAEAIGEAVRDLGFEIRAGCHTGESS
jgi:class 3 adenylate cyclase